MIASTSKLKTVQKVERDEYVGGRLENTIMLKIECLTYTCSSLSTSRRRTFLNFNVEAIILIYLTTTKIVSESISFFKMLTLRDVS